MVDRVLVVEDDGDVRAMLRLMLEDDGYEVIEAADGGVATTRATTEHPDLVILDLRLPVRHGLEVCRLVRLQSTVPILVVSAEADSVEIVAALEAGADDYVTKPFVPRELTRAFGHSSGARQSPDMTVRPTASEIWRSVRRQLRRPSAARSSTSPRPSSCCCASSPTTSASS